MASLQKIMRDTQADVLVVDTNEDPVLLVEVKATKHLDRETCQEIVDALREKANRFYIPFFMLADLTTLRIFRRDGGAAPVLEIPTEAVLSAYDAAFVRTRESGLYHHYLEHLIEAWVADLAQQWKPEAPPYKDRIAGIGLGVRMARGSTLLEAAMAT